MLFVYSHMLPLHPNPLIQALGKNNYLAMNRLRIIISSILSGAIAGAIILGLMGRFALSIVSLSMGKSTNLSLSGMSEALIAGAIIGVVGQFLALISDIIAGYFGLTPQSTV